jgi:hypothetical protein
MEHPSGIPDKIVKKVVARRGRLHAFENIEGARTALIVIDLDMATVEGDDQCKRMTPIVNDVASAVRNRAGVVACVLSRMTAMPNHFAAILESTWPRSISTTGRRMDPEHESGTSSTGEKATCWRSSPVPARFFQASAI